MLSSNELIKLVLIGVGATAVMDAWSVIQKALGIPTLDYAMVGGRATSFEASLCTPASPILDLYGVRWF